MATAEAVRCVVCGGTVAHCTALFSRATEKGKGYFKKYKCSDGHEWEESIPDPTPNPPKYFWECRECGFETVTPSVMPYGCLPWACPRCPEIRMLTTLHERRRKELMHIYMTPGDVNFRSPNDIPRLEYARFRLDDEVFEYQLMSRASASAMGLEPPLDAFLAQLPVMGNRGELVWQRVGEKPRIIQVTHENTSLFPKISLVTPPAS